MKYKSFYSNCYVWILFFVAMKYLKRFIYVKHSHFASKRRGEAFMVQIRIRENRIEMICRSLRIIRVDKKVFPWMWILNHFDESFIGMSRDTRLYRLRCRRATTTTEAVAFECWRIYNLIISFVREQNYWNVQNVIYGNNL